MTVEMFRRIGLDANFDKTKVMVCMPGFFCGGVGGGRHISDGRRVKGGGDSRERKNLLVIFTEFGVTVAASCIRSHIAQIHGIFVPQTRGVDKVGGGPTTYVVSFPRIFQEVNCLVSGYLAVSHSTGVLREHFMYQHLC